MEEEPNEQELEERLYAMLHHADETQADVTTDQNTMQSIENAVWYSTLKRYWRTSGESNPFQKINTTSDLSTNRNIIQNTKHGENVTNKNAVNSKPNENKNIPIEKQNENKNVQNSKQYENKNSLTAKQIQDKQISTKPKEEKSKSPLPAVDLSFFRTPPQNCKKVIEILEHDIGDQVILESSDEDEVIEVALPPKPTITIESSDEDELRIVNTNTEVPCQAKQQEKLLERDISASPVPSVVSSVSDEFIRGDCIALKISSRHSDNPSFDFSLHGSDLLHQSTPSKKKKKKKSKDAATSTPIVQSSEKTVSDECFATPKSKAKNKKPKKKTYTVADNSVPSVDVYDSDSNQSVIDTAKSNSYVVTEKSLPNADVYESDSNQSEIIKEKSNKAINELDSSDSSVSVDKNMETPKSSKKNDQNETNSTYNTISLVDLTESDNCTSFEETGICESIVMGNVTGFTESDNYEDENVDVSQKNVSMFGSTKVPAILNADLDFDNLKGKDKVCKWRRYSLTTLRAEMEKFYNESWGGEDFNHREIQKSMSRDKSLWAIDPKDKMMSPMAKKKVTCNYCNRTGHRDDTCRMKPPVCYMCGSTGHFEPRCPRKICVNCGSPNHMYSTMCSNCRHWGSVTCAECGQNGHPASHCPDLWRRYHNTIDGNTPLQRNQHTKKYYHLYCSGCTKRGHLVHTCRSTIPFSGLPINTPYVCIYRPIYPNVNENCDNTPNNRNKSISQDSTVSSQCTPRNDKRQCKSPNVHESHLNKKRNTGSSVDEARNVETGTQQRKVSISDDGNKKNKETPKDDNNEKLDVSTSEAADFIPITPSNQDKKGNMIQDNEVSDTSSAVTSARIYVTNEIMDKIKTKDGQQWLKEAMEKCDVIVHYGGDINFLNIRGNIANQEAFQNEFRKWAKCKSDKEESNELDISKENQIGLRNLGMLPKNRMQLIRTLKKAFASLENELGDPNALYKELTFLQNQKQKLLTKKDISPKQVSNNRIHINRYLKTLNMVLIGQAGLADGTQHLNELHMLQQKLIKSKEMLISSEERMEILEHYSSIFGPVHRDDYSELLNKYYKSSSIFKKKNKESFKVSPKKKPKNHDVNIPPQTAKVDGDKQNEDKTIHGDNKNAHIKKKLIFYHRRLLRARPNGADLKKKRGELVRRLHSFIASTSANITSKKLRKIKKIQEQAQMFLVHV